MSIVLFNIKWMLVNIGLALIPVYAGWLFLHLRAWYWKVFFGVVWILFVPNTIYILTDIIHLPEHLEMTKHPTEIFFLLIQYALLLAAGIITFILAVYPIEKILHNNKKNFHTITTNVFLAGINFIIALGVMLGRIQRTNSWEALTNFMKVMEDLMQLLASPTVIFFIIIFGILCNGIYFSLRDGILTLLVPVDFTRQKRRKR